MRFMTVLTLMLTLTLFHMTLTAAKAQETPADPGANAALKYWDGFALLPTMDHEHELKLAEWNKRPLDAATLGLMQRSELSRKYLHRGTKLARCDWSLDYDDGLRLVMPHLSKSITLARLAALHARYEFEQGHWQAGWDDVAAILKFARHIQMTPIMIGVLVGYRIESMAIEAASPWLLELKAGISADSFAMLDALPAGAALSQLVLTETQIGPAWLVIELKQAEERKTGGWQAVWNEVLLAPVEEPGNPIQEFAKSVNSFEQAQKVLADHLALNDQLAKISGLPWKEFDVQYPEFVKRMKSVNPQAGFLLPNLEKFIPAQRRCLVQMSLLKAALAVVQGGHDKLQEIQDPFGDRPFEYRRLDNGFELKSKLVFKGAPVALTVGRPSNR